MSQGGLGLGIQGFMSGMHSVGENCTVLQWKICENCAKGFTRPYAFFAREGVKYCGDCRLRSLMPSNDELYREVLRSEGLSERDLPRQAWTDPFISRFPSMAVWQPKLTAEFFARPEGLTIIEIAGITGRSKYSVPNLMVKSGYELVKITVRNQVTGEPARYQMIQLCPNRSISPSSDASPLPAIN